MVDKHPFRHDPSHIVTHRIHSNIVEFADYVLKAEFPHLSKEWSTYLQMINVMVINYKELVSKFDIKLFGNFCVVLIVMTCSIKTSLWYS